MSTKQLLALTLSSLLLAGLPLIAQADDHEVTMMVLDEDATPESAYEIIELPTPASQQAQANSAKGLETANNAREKAADKRQQALEKAQEASNNDVARGVLGNLPDAARNKIPKGNGEPSELPDAANAKIQIP